MLWLPERRILLAGDTMEDTVTYVDEPEQFDAHLADLKRLRELRPDGSSPPTATRTGSPPAATPPGFNDATRSYIRLLQRMPDKPELREVPLRELIADSLTAGDLIYFEPYEAVHRENVETVLAAAGPVDRGPSR